MDSKIETVSVAREILELCKNLISLHMVYSKTGSIDVNYMLFRYNVNMHGPRYNFVNKGEWLFVFGLELNLLEYLKIITNEENKRIFGMLQSDKDNVYLAVLSIRQLMSQKDKETPLLKAEIMDVYKTKIATPELMMFKIKNKL